MNSHLLQPPKRSKNSNVRTDGDAAAWMAAGQLLAVSPSDSSDTAALGHMSREASLRAIQMIRTPPLAVPRFNSMEANVAAGLSVPTSTSSHALQHQMHQPYQWNQQLLQMHHEQQQADWNDRVLSGLRLAVATTPTAPVGQWTGPPCNVLPQTHALSLSGMVTPLETTPTALEQLEQQQRDKMNLWLALQSTPSDVMPTSAVQGYVHGLPHTSLRTPNAMEQLQALQSLPRVSHTASPVSAGQAMTLGQAKVQGTRLLAAASRVSDTATDLTGIPICLPVTMARPTDALQLSALQTLLREQIQVFAATDDDVTTHVRGRNKTIRVGQVGIQCRHCAYLPIPLRHKGSSYFPTSVWGYYQASQNMITTHMYQGGCSVMPQTIKAEIARLVTLSKQMGGSTPSGAGRSYWAQTAKALGLVDLEGGVYFVRNLPTDLGPPAKAIGNSGVYRTCHRKREIKSDKKRHRADQDS